jgi:hypothetical protein
MRQRPHRPRARAGHRGKAGLLVATLLLIAGCNAAPGDAATGPAGDAFYQPPSPMPAGGPGDVIWHRPTPYPGPVGTQADLVLYLSQNATGARTAVSGTVIVPTAPWAGEGPRPIIGVAPFALGLGDSCAASKAMGLLGDPLANEALNRGWAVAYTDLEGLGTPGTHTFMVGPSQGRALLDVVRAATRLPGLGLSPDAPVGLAGYSQGGAAAAWAGELRADYAPELRVGGVSAGGVPADLVAVTQRLQGTTAYWLVVAGAVGFDAAYPELHLDGFLTDTGRTEFAKARDLCLAPLALEFWNHRTSDYTTADPLADPAWRARLNESRAGQRSPGVPAQVWHGLSDATIPVAQAQQLARDWCARGTTVSFERGDGDHANGRTTYAGIYTSFLAGRFAGDIAPSTC